MDDCKIELTIIETYLDFTLFVTVTTIITEFTELVKTVYSLLIGGDFVGVEGLSSVAVSGEVPVISILMIVLFIFK